MNKMSNAKFRTIILTTLSIVLALAIIATDMAGKFAASLNFAFGLGERHVVSVDVAPEKAEYYKNLFADATESQAAAAVVALKIAEEGTVLMKNENGALPLSSSDVVTPIGYDFINPQYGGAGSAKVDTTADYVITPMEALEGHFTVNADMVAAMTAAEPEVMVYPDDNDDTNLSEYNVEVYESAADSAKGTVGIVFIGRPSMEGYDYNSTVAYEDGTPTQLDITANEQAMIEFAKANCSKVVVIVNSSTQLPIANIVNDADIDAIVWIGLPGAVGFEAMAEILDGSLNPSGKLPDIWYADLQADPTWINHKSTAYTNAVEGGPSGYIDYEEGIYLGYRYYETRYAEDNAFSVFGETKGYDDAVLFPFGFGLNYEDDLVTQELKSVSLADGVVTVSGTVTNASSLDVKEVVQVYYGAPYTAGGIEKSAKELVAYDKVAVAAGKTESFTVSFKLEDMVSYDHKGIYAANGAYVLEAGDYAIYLGKDSHNSWGEDKVTVAETLVYADEAISGTAVGKRSCDEIAVSNKFENLTAEAEANGTVYLSRADFAGTYPTLPAEKEMSELSLAALAAYDPDNDARFGLGENSAIYKTEAPAEMAANGLSLIELRGLPYDDPMWDVLLDQLDYSSLDISETITHALYQTAPIEAIGKAATTDHDGTIGLTSTWGGNDALASMFGLTSAKVTATCGYPCGSVQAATFNVDLLREMGESLGAESLTNDVNGWYAPGLNLHRTPFGSRSFEYYSEDPLVTGKCASAVISGAFTNGGLYTYMKHFVLNETEDNRSGVSIWTNEQVLRELYLKPFQIAVTETEGEEKYYDAESGELKTVTVNAARGVMTSMNYVGSESPTNSYALLTEILRDEWGFEGMVITDFTSGTYKRPDVGYRLGNDIWMSFRTTELDLSSPTAKWAARNAIHNVAYVVVNSNTYNNVAPGSYVVYDTAPWQIALNRADIAVGVVAALGIVWIILRQLDEKKNPGKYKK